MPPNGSKRKPGPTNLGTAPPSFGVMCAMYLSVIKAAHTSRQANTTPFREDSVLRLPRGKPGHWPVRQSQGSHKELTNFKLCKLHAVSRFATQTELKDSALSKAQTEPISGIHLLSPVFYHKCFHTPAQQSHSDNHSSVATQTQTSLTHLSILI